MYSSIEKTHKWAYVTKPWARKSTECAIGLWFSNGHSVVWSLKSYPRVLIPIGLLFPFWHSCHSFICSLSMKWNCYPITLDLTYTRIILEMKNLCFREGQQLIQDCKSNSVVLNRGQFWHVWRHFYLSQLGSAIGI